LEREYGALTKRVESPAELNLARNITPVIIRTAERDSTRKDRMFVNKTRRKTMTYNKPEILKLDSALSAIQGNNKGTPHSDNAGSSQPPATPNAYESDE
jgi:hypothetical protein